MAELDNPPLQKVIRFLRDVETKVDRSDYLKICKMLQKEELDENDLDTIVDLLREDTPLMKDFNMFLKGTITYWKDPEGRTHLIGEYGNNFSVVYFSEEDKEVLSTAEYGKMSRDFAKEVLVQLKKEDCEHVESVLKAKKVPIRALRKVSDIIFEASKDLQETEKYIIMFGNLLFQVIMDDFWYASIWTNLDSDSGNEKKVVLYSRDSNRKFEFINLEKEENTAVPTRKRARDGARIKEETD